MTERLPEILRKPEFQERCEAFLDDVKARVAPDYPDLNFYTENSTFKNLQRSTEEIDESKKNNASEKLIRKLLKKDRQLEADSAERMVALVGIQGKSETVSPSRVREAMYEVESYALTNSGLKRPGFDEYNEENLAQVPPRMAYAFSFIREEV